jgi:hypothetical protein
MATDIQTRLNALLRREIAAAEAASAEAPGAGERHQRALTLATLFRVAILAEKLAAILAAAADPAPKVAPNAAPKAAPKVASAVASKPVPEPTPIPTKETDMDDDIADDPARMDALRDAIERQLERITGRRESKCSDQGFEPIGGEAADGGLADAGAQGPAAAGDG